MVAIEIERSDEKSIECQIQWEMHGMAKEQTKKYRLLLLDGIGMTSILGLVIILY